MRVQDVEGGRTRGDPNGSWATAHNSVLTITAASVAPLLHLVFIYHYATDSFYSDDWRVAPLVHAALHGHLSLSQLWAQFNESRLFIGNLVFVSFGFVDGLDLRSVIFLSAALFIASYIGLLILLPQYLGKPLTPIPVLIIGVIWFSLADVENALWAFQVSWYLTVFFFVMMLVALQVPSTHRRVWLGIAVLLACVASLTTIQGFLCWPVGAVCLLWSPPSGDRARFEIALWLFAMIVTVALFLPGYSFGEGNTCLPRARCTPGVLVDHPLRAVEFSIALIGNVIPGVAGFGATLHSITRFEVVGLAILAAAIFVLVQSWRHRSAERAPLPVLLILFALLFDLVISIGRGGTGATGAVMGNRFVMANLILLVGIVIYAWAHLPAHRAPVAGARWRVYVTYLALFALAVLLVVQAAAATSFGLTNGRAISRGRTNEARVLVNSQFHSVLSKARSCQLFLTLEYEPSRFGQDFRDALGDQLGEFHADPDRYYHRLGPPPPPPACQPRHR